MTSSLLRSGLSTLSCLRVASEKNDCGREGGERKRNQSGRMQDESAERSQNTHESRLGPRLLLLLCWRGAGSRSVVGVVSLGSVLARRSSCGNVRVLLLRRERSLLADGRSLRGRRSGGSCRLARERLRRSETALREKARIQLSVTASQPEL